MLKVLDVLSWRVTQKTTAEALEVSGLYWRAKIFRVVQHPYWDGGMQVPASLPELLRCETAGAAAEVSERSPSGLLDREVPPVCC